MVAIHPITVPFKICLSPTIALDRFVNLFLVEGKELALIDSGVKGSETVVLQHLRSLGRRPRELKKLILTHSHPDHMGAAREIVEATGCEVLAHAQERAWIEDPSLQRAARPVPGFDSLVSGPVAVDMLVEDGDRIDVGRGSLTVVATPGHSPGHISLWSPEGRTVITGDAVPVPGELPIYDDAFSSLASLRRVRGLGAEVMLSAWERPLQGREIVKRLDDASLLVQTIHRSVVCNSQGRDVTPELVAAVLRDLRIPPEQANPLVARTILSHLHYKYDGRQA